MPDFPPCPPDVPDVLNPLNLHHYWLLFKWIFFQPSKLKHYLYGVDPALYGASGTAILKTWRIPAYVNLYFMSIALTVSLAIVTTGLVSILQDTSIVWVDLVVGVALGMAFGVALGTALGMVLGTALGVASGTTFGVAFGTALGITLGTALSLSVGAANVASGVASGVAFGTALSVLFSAGFGAAYSAMFSIAVGVVLGAYLVGLALFNVASDTVLAFGLAIVAGSTRSIFYLLEFPLALLLDRSKKQPFDQFERYYAAWDELTAWPLLGIDQLLQAALTANFSAGTRLVIQVCANPFQRWAAQKACSNFLLTQSDPLSTIYRWIKAAELDAYLLPPVSRRGFRNYPSIRLVLIGENGQSFVDETGGESETSERLVWRLTRSMRQMTPSPLSNFSKMLYVLLRDEAVLGTIAIAEIRLKEYFLTAYEGICSFMSGVEITELYAALAEFLETDSLSDLSAAPQHLVWVNTLVEPRLRPTLVEALIALGDVGREVGAYQSATSQRLQSAALNRAAGALAELAGYVGEQVPAPEKVLCQRVIQHWSALVATEQGRLGQEALNGLTPAARRVAGVPERQSDVWARPAQPLDNPYVVGPPVYPPLFVGRKDIFDRIGEVWSAKDTPDSIILFGHRRMGKSSILRNLNQAAPGKSVIVYADMAGETSFVASTADLLLGLAERIWAAVDRAFPEAALPHIDPADYATPAQSQFQFNRLLASSYRILGSQTLILALDEFEAMEKAVKAGKIGPEIYQFLRAKTQEPHTTIIFGGLHTLDEMSREYQQPFYGSYANIRVSYLSRAAAVQLITNPTPEFALNYDTGAVERIIAETGGQPYLLQQVCRDAIDHLNHALFDEHEERDVRLTLADIEAVLGPDFFQGGTVYFDGVWDQVVETNQRQVLCAMAQSTEPWTPTELESETGLALEDLQTVLRWAERHDILQVVSLTPPSWGFWVPLMRRWIQERAAI